MRTAKPATVVRGVLRLADETGVLFDFSGRRVADLRRGANNVSGLAPGVYFVKEQSVESGRSSGVASVHKVVLTR